MRRILAASLLVSALVALAPSTASSITRRHAGSLLTILVVAGQSNALGFQSFVVDPTTHKDIWKGAGSSSADRNTLITYLESGVKGEQLPVPLDTPQTRGGSVSPIFGPEVGLARYLYAKGNKSLLVVKVAFSGTSLAHDWSPKGPDLALLEARVQASKEWAQHAGWVPVVGGVYWMQGESDAMSAVDAGDYRTHLLRFMTDVRASLDLAKSTPFVIGQIDLTAFIQFEEAHKLCPTRTCTAEKRWNAEVMRAQSSVAGKFVFVAKTARLPRYADALHLTDAGELALGKTFGELSAAHLQR